MLCSVEGSFAMSVRRFAGYFLALVACATVAFSVLPYPSDPPPAPPPLTRPLRLALAH